MPGEETMSAADHTQAVYDAEAASRRAESEAAVLRSRAQRSGNPAHLKGALREALQEEIAAKQEEERLRSSRPPGDLSGVTATLSDSAGNFAANLDVARTGGIGVEASNTDASTGAPAEKPEEAGTGGEKVIGGEALVTIPDDWRGLSWQDRRSLASQVSETPIRDGKDADAAIEAELKRRAG